MGGSALADLVVGVRFLRALPSFVRTRITPEQARFALRHRLEHRQARFLAMVRQAVYEHPGSPYRELLRSFEKLTAGGMTFLGADVIRVLEDVLPHRFGGGPADYQLVEAEGPDGSARLRLLVHPAVGPLDPKAVSGAFVGSLSSGSGPERVMGLAWREAALVRVERRPPLTTASGKVLHLHAGRGQPDG